MHSATGRIHYKVRTAMKSNFRSDIPVPDTVWDIVIFDVVFAIFVILFRLSLSHTDHNAMKWLYIFYIVFLLSFCVYAWRKRNECLSQRYNGIGSMDAEEKNKLVEEQTEYFRYQHRIALLIGFWVTLLTVLLFFFFNAVDLPSIANALIDPLIFGWSFVIWRVVMSIYYLRKLKQIQQPI